MKKTVIILGIIMVGAVLYYIINEDRKIAATHNSMMDPERAIKVIKKSKHKNFAIFKNFMALARTLDDDNKWYAICEFKIDTFYFQKVPLRVPLWQQDSILVNQIKKMAYVKSISYDSSVKIVENYLIERKEFYDELGYSCINGFEDSVYVYVGDYSMLPRKNFIVIIDSTSLPSDKRQFDIYRSIGKKVYAKFYVF